MPEDYLRIASGLGETRPRQICVTPLLLQQQLKGDVEVATLGALTDLQLEYLAQAVPQIAVTLETVEARERVRLALVESQRPNSLLLPARRFVDNQEGKLAGDQVESARVIHSSGNDLLSLTNEILDLSKIEAGRMELHWSHVPVSELAGSARDAFQHVAEQRGLNYTVEVSRDAPASLNTDRNRPRPQRSSLQRGWRTIAAGGISDRTSGARRILEY